MKVLVAITLTVAVFGYVTSSAALEANQNNLRTTHKDEGSGAVKTEGKVDVINNIHLEDQSFWKRTLSLSTFIEGDSSYVASTDASSYYRCFCEFCSAAGAPPPSVSGYTGYGSCPYICCLWNGETGLAGCTCSYCDDSSPYYDASVGSCGTTDTTTCY